MKKKVYIVKEKRPIPAISVMLRELEEQRGCISSAGELALFEMLELVLRYLSVTTG